MPAHALVLLALLLGAAAARAEPASSAGGPPAANASASDGGPPAAHTADAGPPCPADAGPCPAESDAALQRELEQALQKDAQAAKGEGRSAPAGATTSPESAPQGGGQQGSGSNLGRAIQSMNPDLSGIVDAVGGFERRGPTYRGGDDPDLRGGPSSKGAGFTVQEVEVALSAIVDPYFKGEIYLTIPNLAGLEVEEAFATTTSLPWNLQVKAGTFRSAFGRQNGQHLHLQDFTRRPLVNAAFLGDDGLRGPGAQVSWLAPLPVFLTLTAEAFSLRAPDATADAGPVASFGGGEATDLTYVGTAKLFVPVTDELSVYAGASVATGVSPGFLRSDLALSPGANRRSVLVAGDLYVKWKPANVVGGYTSVAWQTEAIFRHLEDAAGIGGEWDGGLYSQLAMQVARRWIVGVRGDWLGVPTSSVLGRVLRGSASLTFVASEFARIRAYGELERAVPSGAPYLPAAHSAADPATSFAAYVQLEFSIGAHGAHPF